MSKEVKAALIGVVGTLIGAVIAGVLAVNQDIVNITIDGDDGGDETTTEPPTGPGGGGTPVPPAGPEEGPADVVYTDQELRPNPAACGISTSIDLDEPSVLTQSSDRADLYICESDGTVTLDSAFGVVTAADSPDVTPAECVELIRTTGSTSADIETGGTYCTSVDDSPAAAEAGAPRRIVRLVVEEVGATVVMVASAWDVER